MLKCLCVFFLYQIKVQRTLNWVLSQDSKCDSSSGSGQSGHTTPDPGSRPGRQRNDAENNVNVDTTMPPPGSTKPVAHTMPSVSITTALDSLWIDKGKYRILLLFHTSLLKI